MSDKWVVCELRHALDQARDELRECVEMLRHVEYSHDSSPLLGRCPSCSAGRQRGHSRSCELAALLRRLEGRDE
jgi:DNA-binding helix-hairpin-helix protein with protein kinase domain